MPLLKLFEVIILLLLATKLLVGNETISLNNNFYPEPFLDKKIDLNSPDDVLRMVRIIELYPLLKDRVDELEKEKQNIIDLSIIEKNILLDDYEEQNKKLKKKANFWFYFTVIGIPIFTVGALAGGIYLGIQVSNQ